MKRKFSHPEPSPRELSGPRYWRSLDELADTPGFRAQLQREFPQGASELDGVDRRQFLKIMAASFALGGIGLAGCRRPEKYIMPYGKSVEGVIDGVPQYYATAMPLRKSAIPLLAETHMGRPTKLEGNPTYAPHGGGASLLAQASVLDLYDPDRAIEHTRDGRKLAVADINDLLAKIGTDHTANGGAGLAFLADESSSPTRARLVTMLQQKFPRAIWAEYEALTDEPPLEAARAAFGQTVKPLYRFAKAKRVVALDSDFLGADAGHLYYAREFAKGRRVHSKEQAEEMNRLYVAESGSTLTGSMADHRLRLASSHIVALAAALAVRITGDHRFASLAQGLDLKPEWVEECAADLLAHKGASLVVAGVHQPAAVHAIAYAINEALGAIGATVDFVTIDAPTASTISGLATAIKAGSVSTLIILGGNPAYNAPADLDWTSLQQSVANVIRLGYHVDETDYASPKAVHLAAAHYLESWGDVRTADGTIVPVQPMILPLFGGLTQIEVLARIAGVANPDPYALVYETITAMTNGDPEKFFRKFLHDGLLENTAFAVAAVTLDAAGVAGLFAGAPKLAAPSKTNVEVRFIGDYTMDDGRFINNGWLQECPDPISRLMWDNAILISPRLAREIGAYPHGSPVQIARVESTDDSIGRDHAFIAEVTVGGKKLRGPLHIQPGLSNYTIVLPLGYGRRHTGRVGTGAGFDAYPLRTTQAMHFVGGASIVLTGEKQLLADAQAHWSMEGRDLVREANTGEYIENPEYVKEVGMESETPPLLGATGQAMSPQQRATEIPRGNSLYVTPSATAGTGFTGPHQWGMSIDLNTCIGCNACVVACQAENNIPIVGRDQAIRGREMHWIRLDRYYSDGLIAPGLFGGEANRIIPGDSDDPMFSPQVSLQPVTCQQCELAPCEMVCPVNATVHDNEGLNAMVYNRCIGTRYCANNCPYKVRRFNYFDYNEREIGEFYMGPLGPEGMPELVQMVKNPEVTIRMRGVMEKCTFCVQRITNGEIRYRVAQSQAGHPGNVVVPDGTIKTACQQVCPVGAIVFGNIMDPESEVSKLKALPQDYQLLGYLNTRPRLTYLGKLRNPNPRMPDYAALPLSRVERLRKNVPPGFHEEPEKKGGEKTGNEHTAFNAMKSLGGLS